MTGKSQWRPIEDTADASGDLRSSGATRKKEAVPDKREAAAYVRDMAADLRDLADAAQLPLLAYLLDMARAEANNLLK